MSDIEEMIRQAAAAREHAYAPYSGFKVGACLRTVDGRMFVGCNVENVAFPQSQCAEATAIGNMVAAGGAREIAEVVIIAAGTELCTPCGGCRQRLSEFGSEQTKVYIAGLDGLRATFTLGELMPHAFEFRKVKA